MGTSWSQIKAERPETADQRRGYDGARRLFETGVAVRELRLALGLSQREVARRAGVAAATISRLESGEVMPAVDSLARISEVLGARLELAIVPTPAA